MAFKLTQKPTFTTKVTVNIANDKGGFDKSWFMAKFKRLSTSQLDELRQEGASDEDVVRKVLVDWEMTDEDTNEPVPFNAETLEAVLQVKPTPHAIAVAFFEAINGARAKN